MAAKSLPIEQNGNSCHRNVVTLGERRVTMGERLGLDDFFSTEVWRAALVELIGTEILIFTNATIAISAIENNIGGAPTLVMSILMGTTIALLVFATMPISGGHLNPVITMSTGLMGLISLSRALIYILAQCTGGVLSALALKAVLSSDIEHKFSLGGCAITGLELNQAFYLELICCFNFLFVLRWIVFDQKLAKSYGQIVNCLAIGIIAALNIFLSTTVTGAKGYSGAGMSPARCLGPAIVRGGNLWHGHWIFWIAPAMASISYYTCTRFVTYDHLQSEENIHDFVNILKVLFQLETLIAVSSEFKL